MLLLLLLLPIQFHLGRSCHRPRRPKIAWRVIATVICTLLHCHPLQHSQTLAIAAITRNLKKFLLSMKELPCETSEVCLLNKFVIPLTPISQMWQGEIDAIVLHLGALGVTVVETVADNAANAQKYAFFFSVFPPSPPYSPQGCEGHRRPGLELLGSCHQLDVAGHRVVVCQEL